MLPVEAAALQYARQGVRINSVCPGVITTPILGDLRPEDLKAVDEAIPMGRRGKPEDIAYASLYLCSDEAEYVTGSDMVVDGGSTAI